MTTPLRVATIGTGYFSRFHYKAWKRLADEGRVELVGVCNRSRSSAQELAALYGSDSCTVFTDVQTMLQESTPHLLDIITPPLTHDEYVKVAVNHGVPAICQKPFTTELNKAESLVSYIQENNATVIIHENFRFQPWYEQLKALIAQGAIGEPLQLSFRLRPGDGQGPQAYMERQPYFQTMERFLIHETAIHTIDVFRYLFGEIKTVYADLKKLNPAIVGEDAGVLLFEFDSGKTGLFDGNRLIDHEADNTRLTMGEMRIEGTDGVLDLNGRGEIHLRKHGSRELEFHQYEWRDEDFGGDCVYRFQSHVLDHFQHGTALVNTAGEYLKNLQIEEAAYDSAVTGRKIDL